MIISSQVQLCFSFNYVKSQLDDFKKSERKMEIREECEASPNEIAHVHDRVTVIFVISFILLCAYECKM